MPSDIDDLKKELDIVDVISEYINLQRVGNNYRANCPFHPDRTPSFYVSPSRQIFKCFGCGVGGDAIKFVSLYENVSYYEAARELAKKRGIRLKIRENTEALDKLYEALDEVSEFYHAKLKETPRAIDYLSSRGIDNHSIRRFKLGFSPTSGELISFLERKDMLEEYRKTGNIILLKESKYRDLLRGRLIIPIRDYRGRVVGFGGRSLGDEEPKYINSPESDVFKKRHLVFGLYEGLAYLKEFNSAILVEGYFDVIALHQEGFRSAVATLGTSLGREHASLLSRFVKRVYAVFDGDTAGRKALRMAIPHLLEAGIEVFPVYLPEGYDPHDFLFSQGKKAFRELLDKSTDIFSLLLRQIRKGENVEEAIRDFTYFVSFVRDEIEAFSLLSELSRVTKIPLDVLSSRSHKRERPREEENKLSFTERLFLKGLMELRPEVNLEELRLSSKAREYAVSILNEEYYCVPEDILNLKVDSLEDAFWSSLESLRLDIPEEELTFQPSSVKEVAQEARRNHRGGIRSTLLKRRRGKA